MNNHGQSGITLLLFAILISSSMLLCLGIWKATTYFVDFAGEKERYLQKRVCMEGIMRWAVHKFAAMDDQLSNSQTITMNNWPFTLKRFKGSRVTVTLHALSPMVSTIEAVIANENTRLAQGSYTVTKQKKNNKDVLLVQAWTVVV